MSAPPWTLASVRSATERARFTRSDPQSDRLEVRSTSALPMVKAHSTPRAEIARFQGFRSVLGSARVFAPVRACSAAPLGRAESARQANAPANPNERRTLPNSCTRVRLHGLSRMTTLSTRPGDRRTSVLVLRPEGGRCAAKRWRFNPHGEGRRRTP